MGAVWEIRIPPLIPFLPLTFPFIIERILATGKVRPERLVTEIRVEICDLESSVSLIESERLFPPDFVAFVFELDFEFLSWVAKISSSEEESA